MLVASWLGQGTCKLGVKEERGAEQDPDPPWSREMLGDTHAGLHQVL